MAAGDNSQRRIQDVTFTKTTSTKHWGRGNPNLNPATVTKENPISAYPNYLGNTPRVVRTGGITGTLPSHSTRSANSPASSAAASAPPPITTTASSAPPPPLIPPPAAANPPHLTRDAKNGHDALNKSEVEKKPLPSEDVLYALFERVTKRMKLPPERVMELNTRTPEQKWSMILSQNEIEAGIACVFYIEQLVRHTQPELKEKRPKKRLLMNLQPLSKVLSDLEVDLRTNPNDSWVKDFIATPNHGHVALIDLIKDLADTPHSVQRKNSRRYSALERDPSCLYTALLCLKALMGHRKGFGAVLKYDPSLCVLAYCLDNQNVKIKILILKMMVTVLLAPGGHRKVMQAFDYFRAIMKERARFQLLMSSLSHEPAEPAYQGAVLCFINTVVQVAQGPNAKVFHQHEFIEAGFSPNDVEKSLHGRLDERILHELKEWKNNFTDVQSYMDNLAVCKGRIRDITEELKTAQKHLNEANSDRESLYKQIKNWIEKTESQRQQIVEMNDTISELLEAKKERDVLLEEKKTFAETKRSYYTHTNELKEQVQQLLDENRALLNREIGVLEQVDSLNKHQTMLVVPSEPESPPPSTPSSPPPPPPPPPPLMEGPFIPPPPPPVPFGIPAPPPPPIGGKINPLGVPLKKPVIPNVPLPMLNWLPIKNPEHTIFKEMDDESIIEIVDFSEFEMLFQVKKSKKAEKFKQREENKRKQAEQLCFIENRRSRNLTIAKRRTGQTVASICESVIHTDLSSLNSEHCELLLKFIPTKEELTELKRHSSQCSHFGEAEDFMYQITKVERYEPRLECMAYMGNFDELINATQPHINAVLCGSLSVLRSTRLKKVFEIILAFGNYMNSSRRGAAHGFKLESLSKIMETKSYDKKQTLLNYITHVVEKVFPNVLTFYEDLDIDSACSVSMSIISEDVSTLREGLKALKEEIEKDPDNFSIFSFHRHASKKVQHLNETFTKMEDAYREVCLMFSESPKTTDPSDFFRIFAVFIDNWKGAVQKNRDSKKRLMASTQDLLRKQEEEIIEPSNRMALLAAEVAAEAAARSEKIRRKALEKMVEREVTSEGEEEEEEEPKGEGRRKIKINGEQQITISNKSLEEAGMASVHAVGETGPSYADPHPLDNTFHTSETNQQDMLQDDYYSHMMHPSTA